MLFRSSPQRSDLGALLYGFSKAGNDGWGDLYVLVYLAVGAVFVALFCLRQLKMDEPFLDITVFKYGEFSLAAILSGVANLALVGSGNGDPTLHSKHSRGIRLPFRLDLTPWCLGHGDHVPDHGTFV